MDEFHEIYNNFLDIKHADTWSLNDLLRYALELIISDDEDCIPLNISEDELSLCRGYMLNEINNAIAKQKENKKIPPMPIVASKLSCLSSILKKDELEMVETLLKGEYGGKKGVKKDAKDTRRDDIERMFIYKTFKETATHEEAINKLAQKEKIHERSAERALKRGEEYFKESIVDSAIEAVGLPRLNIYNLLRHNIIKEEIQILLSCSDAATEINRMGYEQLEKLLENILETMRRARNQTD